MNNYDDSLTLIENYLDSFNHEYQAHDNRIEIYSINKNVIIINIKKNQIMVSSDKGQYKFLETNREFFKKLDILLTNF
tara:strand:+ start:605 stop:838 length:234 start_codon:yes stop_codon:yes gene_type:complete